jgi:hypothetical protein
MLFLNIRAQSGHKLDAQGLHQAAEKTQDGNEGEEGEQLAWQKLYLPPSSPKSQRHHRKAFLNVSRPEPWLPFEDPEA